MTIGICVVLPFAVAVMVAVRVAGLVVPDENVTTALPLESLTAEARLSSPVSAEKVTTTLASAAFELSTTIAVMVVFVLLSDATDVGDALRLTSATVGPVVVPVEVYPSTLLVTVTLLTVAVAVTESAPVWVPAASEIVAFPFASVRAVPLLGTKLPNVEPAVLNVMTTPGSAAPELLFKVAVSVDCVAAEIAGADPTSVSVGLAAAGVVGVVEVEGEFPDPPPPHAPSNNAQTTASNNDIERDELILNLDSQRNEVANAAKAMRAAVTTISVSGFFEPSIRTAKSCQMKRLAQTIRAQLHDREQ